MTTTKVLFNVLYFDSLVMDLKIAVVIIDINPAIVISK